MESDHDMLPNAFAVVVNDDLTQLTILSGLVEESGLEVRSYTSAELALREMVQMASYTDASDAVLPRLIVTDLCMPGIDGWRFCSLLRSTEYMPFNDVPILAVSAPYAGEEGTQMAIDLGAEAFFPSPVDGHRFVEKILEVLETGRRRPLLRVLIVEDSITQSDILRRAFMANGYDTIVAHSAEDALSIFRTTEFNVAVLDFHLPDGSGDMLLDAFRAQRPDCFCLMMTADSGPELALNWIRRGAFAYVHKPFHPAYLIELCALARRERALVRAQGLLEIRTRELRVRDELLNTTQRLAKVGGWEWNIQTGDITWTDELYRILELDPKDFTPGSRDHFTRGLMCFAEEEREALMAAILRCRDMGESFEQELPLSTASGRRKSLKIAAHAFLESKRVIRISGHMMDITEGKLKDAEITRHEKYLDKILQTTAEGFIVFGMNGDVMDANRACCDMLGYSRKELLALNIRDIISDKKVDAAISRMGSIVRDGADFFETSFHRKDNGFIDVDISISFMPEESGKFVGFCRDVSERKRAESERAELEGQLQQAQKMESIGRLAGGVAHDFNNMLQVILGNVDIAMTCVPTDNPAQGHLEEICNAAERSVALTRQLLAFARKQAIFPRVLDLNDALEGILKMLKRLIGEGVTLTWRPGQHVGPINIDPSQIDQILANLCVNARDAVESSGEITIETGNLTVSKQWNPGLPGITPGQYVWLSVTDNGCGMSSEVIPHIFEPFFTTKGANQGTGLGLATVYGIVKQNGGVINVKSEPHKGTSFTAYFPRYLGNDKNAESETQSKRPLQGHETLLLVEDETTILHLMSLTLKLHGYTVLSASTPEEALSLAENHSAAIDLLLVDVVLPKMNGWDLSRQILSRFPEAKCLFMSGYPVDAVAHHGVMDNPAHFLQKPFTVMSLAAKVRELLDQQCPLPTGTTAL